MKFKKLNESATLEKDRFVLYFPHLEPRIIDKERAIKQLEFELDQIKNSSGASLAGRGFGIYCIESYDEDTGTSWTGRYTSKEFLKVISEDIDKSIEEDLEDERDLLLVAGDYKCKLTQYDIEEAADWKMLIEYIKHSYNILKKEFGDNIKMWSFYEDDNSDMINGYKVWLKDGTRHIVEINNERVDIVEEVDLLEEADTRFIIVAVTKEGTRLFYNSADDNFVTNVKDATIYDEHDVAIDDWHKIDKTQFKRVFVPNYDAKLFEAMLTEGTGADTKTAAADIMNILAKDDSKKWAQTASEIINVIPDNFVDELVDTVKKKIGDFKLTAEHKKKIVNVTDGNLTEEQLNDTDTVGKVLELFDTFEWANKNPGLMKGVVMVVLAIVAIIEPSPVVEIITIIIGFLPAEIVAKVMAFLSTLNSPVGHIANQLHKKNEEVDEYETDYRYYVYDSNDNVVSDAFEFDEDAIEWSKENGYPTVKIHNYYRDDSGMLEPEGDPEVIWTAE